MLDIRLSLRCRRRRPFPIHPRFLHGCQDGGFCASCSAPRRVCRRIPCSSTADLSPPVQCNRRCPPQLLSRDVVLHEQISQETMHNYCDRESIDPHGPGNAIHNVRDSDTTLQIIADSNSAFGQPAVSTVVVPSTQTYVLAISPELSIGRPLNESDHSISANRCDCVVKGCCGSHLVESSSPGQASLIQ